MATEAPSWADQWGAGGFGAMEDDSTRSQNDTSKNKNSGAKGGFSKAKAIASNCVK
ncbi:ankyrin repeat protein, partial [Trifolium medium]|nr:ankyrin repeat protein [Trifolium medium]